MRKLNTIGGIDATPHSGIQPWSKGDLFPAVFVVVETYDTPEDYLAPFYAANVPLKDRLLKTEHEVRLYGETERFDTYADATEWARAKIATRTAPAGVSACHATQLRALAGIRKIMGGYHG